MMAWQHSTKVSAPVKSCAINFCFYMLLLLCPVPSSQHYSSVASLEAACETISTAATAAACLWLKLLNALITVQQMTDGRKLQQPNNFHTCFLRKQ